MANEGKMTITWEKKTETKRYFSVHVHVLTLVSSATLKLNASIKESEIGDGVVEAKLELLLCFHDLMWQCPQVCLKRLRAP